jgi:hypothetical protein
LHAVFVELPAFERHRADYLDDAAFADLQEVLMTKPTAGKVMRGTGGLRKLRVADARRCKGKRGGIRVIYYWWERGLQFWLFTLYDKDELENLTPDQARELGVMVKLELSRRRI